MLLFWFSTVSVLERLLCQETIKCFTQEDETLPLASISFVNNHQSWLQLHFSLITILFEVVAAQPRQRRKHLPKQSFF